MAERSEQLRDAFAALDRGDLTVFKELFRADAQWRGIEGMGHDGETPL
jgi:ketosteroid isomerase-like protein